MIWEEMRNVDDFWWKWAFTLHYKPVLMAWLSYALALDLTVTWLPGISWLLVTTNQKQVISLWRRMDQWQMAFVLLRHNTNQHSQLNNIILPFPLSYIIISDFLCLNIWFIEDMSLLTITSTYVFNVYSNIFLWLLCFRFKVSSSSVILWH